MWDAESTTKEPFSELERYAALAFHSFLAQGPAAWAKLRAIVPDPKVVDLLIRHFGGKEAERQREDAARRQQCAAAIEAELSDVKEASER